MPLVRVGGTPEPDTRPEFWRNWRQLGHAVVLRAVYDYVRMQKKEVSDQNGFHYGRERYDLFFKSRYFSYICPDYDGHLLYDLLENGAWKDVHTASHIGHNATYVPHYIPKAYK